MSTPPPSPADVSAADYLNASMFMILGALFVISGLWQSWDHGVMFVHALPSPGWRDFNGLFSGVGAILCGGVAAWKGLRMFRERLAIRRTGP